ncbi:MAG: CDP-6-deoxy-L-threo-D-glycero-4-hexulose-3-dehydrase reductase [Gammaproteobacteria bacterium]|nr:CDP-6-deoxy-L-threo-D-glycero-4-hexulose-3-dehydrase reductase [Gammaproteobacteria bacterium]
MTDDISVGTPSRFTVRLKGSGTEIQVCSGETILDAALRQGVVLPYSCRTGSCATCKACVVSGEFDRGEFQEQALSAAEQEKGYALLCQTLALSDMEVEAREIAVSEAIEIKQLPCRVVGLKPMAHDVMEVKIKLPRNQRFCYLPGQYIDLLMRDGRRRSFSIANPPNEEGILELHVRRVPDGYLTNYIFEGMRERDLLRFQGPLGTFFLRDGSEDRPVICVAGGTGFAPIKAMLEQAFADEVQCSIHLFWGARAMRDLYMRQLAESWREQYDRFSFTPVLSEAGEHDEWSGNTGWAHDAVTLYYPDLSPYQVYASGPPPMVEALKKAFAEHGLPEDQLFFDSFEFSYDTPDS